MEQFTEINVEYANEVLRCAKDYFCNGIYVQTSGMHPCNWDFISFETIDNIDDDIDVYEISNGIYEEHDLMFKNLLEILEMVGMDGWCFEVSGTINW